LITPKNPDEFDLKTVENNCKLSSPEVQLQLNLKIRRRQLKPEKSGSTVTNELES
jgi:hypothetical protein